MPTHIHTSTTYSLRESINEKLRSQEDFDVFCIDFFPKIHQRFSAGMDRQTKISLLLTSESAEEIEKSLSEWRRDGMYRPTTPSMMTRIGRYLKDFQSRFKNWGWRKHSSRGAPASESRSAATSRLIYVITLESKGDYSENSIHSILRELQKISNDPTLRILSIKQGSIVIELDGTEDGYDQIITAIQQSALKAILNKEIKAIKIERRISSSSPIPAYDLRHTNPEMYNNNQVRMFINRILLTDSMLDAFVLDSFQKTYKATTRTMDRIQKTSLLIEMEDNQDIIHALKGSYPEEFEKCREKIAVAALEYAGVPV